MCAVADLFEGAEIISIYTRAQALDDGTLIALPDAREAGILWPVAITQAAHAEAISWNPDHQGGQDETGRSWDVLTMVRHAIARNKTSAILGDRIKFDVYRVPNTPTATRAYPCRLVVIAGGGDDGVPVLTVMLPNED